MDAILYKSKPKIEEIVDEESEDEFGFSSGFGHFGSLPKDKSAATPTETKESDRTKDVYLDKETGKIVVNPKKHEQTTGFKRGLDRKERTAELEDGRDVN